MLRSVSAFDAKTHFSQLLDRASNGEEILITRRGKAAAKLIPVYVSVHNDLARLAASNIREMAGELNLQSEDRQEWQNYRNIGKK